MSVKQDYLLHMKSHPYFELFLKELQAHRPMIPSYDPEGDNTDKWKFLSAQRKGFDLCCSIFNIKVE